MGSALSRPRHPQLGLLLAGTTVVIGREVVGVEWMFLGLWWSLWIADRTRPTARRKERAGDRAWPKTLRRPDQDQEEEREEDADRVKS